MTKRQAIRGTLITKHGGWAIVDDDGQTHLVRGVEETNISALIGKKRWWVLYQGRGGRWAQRDRRTAAERAAGQKPRPELSGRSVRTISGGAPGSKRRH